MGFIKKITFSNITDLVKECTKYNIEKKLTDAQEDKIKKCRAFLKVGSNKNVVKAGTILMSPNEFIKNNDKIINTLVYLRTKTENYEKIFNTNNKDWINKSYSPEEVNMSLNISYLKDMLNGLQQFQRAFSDSFFKVLNPEFMINESIDLDSLIMEAIELLDESYGSNGLAKKLASKKMLIPEAEESISHLDKYKKDITERYSKLNNMDQNLKILLKLKIN